MGEYNKKDIKLSKAGDIELEATAEDEDGNPLYDFKMTSDTESLEQDIYNRIKTNSPDWELHPEIGGNLEDIIGEKNTQEVAQIAEDQLRKTLTYDNRIKTDDLEVYGIPTDYDEVTFYIKVQVDSVSEPIVIPIPFNFIRGMLE
jgi:hypothetical protein